LSDPLSPTRQVAAVHGRKVVEPDPSFEVELAADLRRHHDRDGLMQLYRRFSKGDSRVDRLMRRACLRAVARTFGNGVQIHPNVVLHHPETFEIGDGVFIGEGAMIQGRFDGRCKIGAAVWIGPFSYFDARNLVLGDYVGWGPGAKVLGSMHTGFPLDVPIIRTDLEIEPVYVEDWADIGVNSVLLPGVRIGKGSIVGAGAVVTKDVPSFAKVAGVPAVVVGWRHRSLE
jgi:acetyltransferase-like isoleucine patch superfamily enzyme